MKFEYWNIDNIKPDIKNIYDINKCNGLRNYFLIYNICITLIKKINNNDFFYFYIFLCFIIN